MMSPCPKGTIPQPSKLKIEVITGRITLNLRKNLDLDREEGNTLTLHRRASSGGTQLIRRDTMKSVLSPVSHDYRMSFGSPPVPPSPALPRYATDFETDVLDISPVALKDDYHMPFSPSFMPPPPPPTLLRYATDLEASVLDISPCEEEEF